MPTRESRRDLRGGKIGEKDFDPGLVRRVVRAEMIMFMDACLTN